MVFTKNDVSARVARLYRAHAYMHVRAHVGFNAPGSAHQMIQIATPLETCTPRMVETTARPEIDASKTQVLLETVLDTVAEPTFWWKPLWKPL